MRDGEKGKKDEGQDERERGKSREEKSTTRTEGKCVGREFMRENSGEGNKDEGEPDKRGLNDKIFKWATRKFASACCDFEVCERRRKGGK